MSSFLTESLLYWNQTANYREMPWKGEKNPYRIWLSEIILQQTRVEQGRDYYEKFINRFPTIEDLAVAQDDQVFKLWEGLGYYTRCRNLIATARYIAYECNGQFPDTYEDIKNLKGVGPYTAAAIASFAYNLPHAVVDGNVLRLLSRVFGISAPISDSSSRKMYNILADELLDKQNPSEYNQAIMDFGATICKPRQPLCESCPLNIDCEAFRNGWVEVLPVKITKVTRRKRFFNYLVFHHEGRMYCRKRTGRDIWQNLFEFCLYESDKLLSPKQLLSSPFFMKLINNDKFDLLYTSPVNKQQLTHQDLSGRFFEIRLYAKPSGLEDFIQVTENELRSLAMPRFILSYLHEKNVNLNKQQAGNNEDKMNSYERS
jgi:A/G-specific adenine glycosylase